MITNLIISVIINTVLVIILAAALPGVKIRSWGTALLMALLIGILNPTIGYLLTIVLNIVTLGLFWLLGLGFIIRLIVFALIIKLTDIILPGLKIKNFGVALLIALCLALANLLVNWLFF